MYGGAACLGDCEATLCLSRVRPTRLSGAITYWPDPEYPDVPWPLYLTFDMDAPFSPSEDSTCLGDFYYNNMNEADIWGELRASVEESK